MYENKPLAEVAPRCRLCIDEMPPLGKNVWLITKNGCGFRGIYHEEYGVIAWAYLPKLDNAQKQRLKELEDECRTDRTHGV